MKYNQIEPISKDRTTHFTRSLTEKNFDPSVSATIMNSLPSPFDDERILTTFLADYHQLLATTSAMFLPAGEWLIHKGYWVKDALDGNNSMSIQVDFNPDTKQIHQYVVHFSAIQSGEHKDILQAEYNPVTKAIVLTGPEL